MCWRRTPVLSLFLYVSVRLCFEDCVIPMIFGGQSLLKSKTNFRAILTTPAPVLNSDVVCLLKYTAPLNHSAITNYSDINYKKHSDLPRNILKHSLMYFIHIPKTGGTLFSTFTVSYTPGMTFWGMMRSAFKQKKAPFRFDTNFAFNSMAAKWLKYVDCPVSVEQEYAVLTLMLFLMMITLPQ